jgi:L-arabinose isomerase
MERKGFDGAARRIRMRRFLEGRLQRLLHFEDLHGLAQLPGLAVQRLMAEGYGLGPGGD